MSWRKYSSSWTRKLIPTSSTSTCAGRSTSSTLTAWLKRRPWIKTISSKDLQTVTLWKLEEDKLIKQQLQLMCTLKNYCDFIIFIMEHKTDFGKNLWCAIKPKEVLTMLGLKINYLKVSNTWIIPIRSWRCNARFVTRHGTMHKTNTHAQNHSTWIRPCWEHYLWANQCWDLYVVLFPDIDPQELIVLFLNPRTLVNVDFHLIH